MARQLKHHEVRTSGHLHNWELVCGDWADPRNVGAAFRLADAIGADLTLAGSTPTPPNSKINKTARSTVRSVHYQYELKLLAYLQTAQERGDFILALEITDSSASLLHYDLPTAVRNGEQRLLLIPGSESTGLAEAVLANCHATVHLPMHGQNSSMNVAVALGAAAYLLLKQLATKDC